MIRFVVSILYLMWTCWDMVHIMPRKMLVEEHDFQRHDIPDHTHPFIFWHLRKCGGSAFRFAIAQSAKKHKLISFIPCHESVKGNLVTHFAHTMHKKFSHKDSCDKFTLDLALGSIFAKNLSVVAGHFYWDSVMSFWGETSNVQKNRLRYEESFPFSCLIFVRHPLNRFQSCYTERFEAYTDMALENLPLATLDNILANWTDGRHGCNNEIARWLSPSGGWGDHYINSGSLSQSEIIETKRRIDQCTIVDLEYNANASSAIVEYSFPWLQDYDFHSLQNEGHHSQHLPPQHIPKSHKDLIMKYNKLDIELYKHAITRFDSQYDSLVKKKKKKKKEKASPLPVDDKSNISTVPRSN